MTDDRRVLWAIVGTTALVLAVVFLSEPVQRELRPEPVRAFIAVEVDGEGIARPGSRELSVGQRFELHGVLEAERRGGRKVYFTEAPGLEIDGHAVAAGDLARWEGPEAIKVLWFSIEGPRPFVELPEDQPLEELAFQAVFRPEWPRSWSIPGSLRPAREAALVDEAAALRRVAFGTMRYQVRFELFGAASTLVPVATFESPPPRGVTDPGVEITKVVAVAPGPLALPSRAFGQVQIDLEGEALVREGARLRDWFDRDLAFSRLLLLKAMVDRAGVTWDALVWSAVDLAAGPAWGTGSVREGDLLRAGERVVVLYTDRGVVGRLDYEDLCMDFLEGAQIRLLNEVFTGEGLVEWTSLRAERTGEG